MIESLSVGGETARKEKMNEHVSNDLGIAMTISENNYQLYTNMCMEAFLPMLCLMLDNWAAVNGKDSAELVKTMVWMVEGVHEELGPMEVMA